MLGQCLNPMHQAIQQSIQGGLPHPDSVTAQIKGFDFVEDHQPTLYSVGLTLHHQSANFSVAAEVTIRLPTMRHGEHPTVPDRQQLNSTAAELPVAAGTLLPPQDSRTKG